MTSGVLNALSVFGFCLGIASAITVFAMFVYLIESLERDQLSTRTRILLLGGIAFFMCLGASGFSIGAYSTDRDQKYIACLSTLPDPQLCEHILEGRK
jgi:hypothetical protein